MTISQKEIFDVLAEVEKDLRKAYEEEAQNLMKAAPGDEESSQSAPEASDSSPAPEAPESAPAESAPAESAAPAPQESAPPAPESAPAPGQSADPAADAGPGLTPEALQAEYGQLSPEELDMHLKAALAAKAALASAQAPQSPGAPDMSAAGAPPDMSAAQPAPAMKGEMKANAANGGQEVPVKKNEEVEELKALVAAQAKALETQKEELEVVAKSFVAYLERPLRKAVTSISDVALPEKKEYSRQEVMKLVGNNAHKLQKHERDLYLEVIDGRKPIKSLEPILEKITQK